MTACDSGETGLVIFVAQNTENHLQPWQLIDLLLTERDREKYASRSLRFLDQKNIFF